MDLLFKSRWDMFFVEATKEVSIQFPMRIFLGGRNNGSYDLIPNENFSWWE